MPLKCILGGSLGNSVSTTQTTSNYVRIYSHDAEQGPKQPTLVHTQSYAPPRPVTKCDVRTQLHSARRTQPKAHHRQRRESQKKRGQLIKADLQICSRADSCAAHSCSNALPPKDWANPESKCSLETSANPQNILKPSGHDL